MMEYRTCAKCKGVFPVNLMHGGICYHCYMPGHPMGAPAPVPVYDPRNPFKTPLEKKHKKLTKELNSLKHPKF